MTTDEDIRAVEDLASAGQRRGVVWGWSISEDASSARLFVPPEVDAAEFPELIGDIAIVVVHLPAPEEQEVFVTWT